MVWMVVACSPSSLLAQDAGTEVSADDATEAVAEEAEVNFQELADGFVAGIEKQAQLRAASEFLDREIKQLEASTSLGADATLLDRLNKVQSDTEAATLTLQGQNYAPYLDSLESAANSIRQDVETARLDLRHTRAELYELRTTSKAANARSNVTARLAVLFNPQNLWVWLTAIFGGVAIAAVYGITRRHHFRRLSWVWRRQLWGRVALLSFAIFVPLVPAGAILFTGDDTYESMLDGGESPALVVNEEGTTEIGKVEEVITREGLEEKLERRQERHKATLDEWRDGIPRDYAREKIVEAWEESRTTLLNLAVDAALLKVLTAQTEADVKELEQLDTEVAGLQSGIAARADSRRSTSGLLGGGLLLAYALGGGGILFRERSRKRRVLITCPRCRCVGKLELVDDGENARTGTMGAEHRCTHVLREDPYTECDFVVNETYLPRDKIMFPTLGVTSSGKTHWLLMVYRDLNRGQFPDDVHFSKIKGRAAAEMDRLVDGMLNHRIRPGATETSDLPHPLIFDFTDNDPLQRSHMLTNVSDYGGEVFERDDHDFRGQLLNAEGYLVFLDPTKTAEGQVDTQVEALGSFRQDLQLYRKIPPGKTIHSPVAVCLSKLDLMVNQDYAQGSDIVWEFYRELAAIDEATAALSLERIQRKSDLVARVRSVIFPGWPVEKQIRDLFGERFMFFPLTPVGLDRPGEEDLSQRSIEPYGTIEPLLWLLHMNGYPVLK